MNNPKLEQSWRDRISGQRPGETHDAGTAGTGSGAAGDRRSFSRAAGRDGSSNRRGAGDDGWQPPGGADGAAEESRGLPTVRPRDQVARGRDTLPESYVAAATYGEPQIDELRIDLRKYLWLLLKHRWLILGSAGMFACLGLAITFLTTPIYRANATIQISRDAPKVIDVQGFQPVDAGGEAEFYQTQYELLRSRSLAERVVSNLNLQDDPVFLDADAPSPWTKLKQWVFGSLPAELAAESGPDVAVRRQSAVGRVLANLTVEPVRSSSIVGLGYDSPNPLLATKIANAIAQGFITENLERRFEASAYARRFLEERLQQTKLKLEESEKEVVAFAEAQNIVNADDKQTLAMTNLTNANDALADATTERLRRELLWRQVQSTAGLGLPQFLESGSIAAMRSKRADLVAEYEDKLSLFKPAYPEMKKIKAQIDELDRQISGEADLVRESIKAEYEAALGEEKSLADHVDALKREVTDFRNRNIQYTILQREVDTNRQLYDGLLQRYKEIGVAGGVGTNNVSIIDQAQVPSSPYTPKLSRNLLIALMLGLVSGGGAAFAREQFDDTFKSPEDLEENLGVPLLGAIPVAAKFSDPASLLADPHAPVAEAYRSLRTALQFSTTMGVPKSLLVTSARASEGKTTTALTLARIFAQLGMRVLLIDADLRKPSLHRHLNCDDTVGLTNYLAGALSPPEAFQATETPELTFMPCGPSAPNPAELIAGSKMLSLLTVASEKFDLVIVDGPPVAGLADAPLLASMAQGTLLLIDAASTRRGAAKAALKRLYFARAQVVGAVINKLDVGGPGSSYGYGYGYGHGYGYGAYGELAYYGGNRGAKAAESENG